LTYHPLRDRIEDIAPLAESMLVFLGRKNRRSFTGFNNEALEMLQRYPWPGNVRELRNSVERAAILCRGEVIGVEHLTERITAGQKAPNVGDLVSLSRIEEEHIRRVMAQSKSLQEAAQVLGIDQATLWRRRKLYGV
jgi:two-component system, NtrC family, response regulator AlgB